MIIKSESGVSARFSNILYFRAFFSIKKLHYVYRVTVIISRHYCNVNYANIIFCVDVFVSLHLCLPHDLVHEGSSSVIVFISRR